MADLRLLECVQAGLGTLERVRYFPRQLLTARRQIYSTAVLQEQLIARCCGDRPPPVTAKVIRVVPPDGVRFDTKQWPGTVTYDEVKLLELYTPQQPFGTAPGIRNTYTLTVFGDEILDDVDNLPLDGNGDGSPGGNFTSTFTVINPPVPPQAGVYRFWRA
jgi:hypothetical protein